MRKGSSHTPEAKARLREARAKQTPWNKGVRTGPQDPEVVRRRALSQTGTKRAVTRKVLDGRVRNAEAHRGKTQSAETRAKRGASLRLAYAEGRKVAYSGYGKGCWYDSPHQGAIWLRSTSELQRARELDEAEAVWFYEVRRYGVHIDAGLATYMPDFWIVPGVPRAQVPGDVEPQEFLASHPHEVEDVKGWWKPTHKTYRKVTAFAEQHPEVSFRVVVRQGIPDAP